MDSGNNHGDNKVVFKSVLFNVLEDGRVVLRFPGATGKKIPPSDDPVTGVKMKDIRISSDVSARVFLPRGESGYTKLPLLLYIHGGGFCMESAFSVVYTRYVSNLAAQANVIVVSVEYSLYSPCRPLPACYEESWAALEWVASHDKGCGLEPWINNHADLQRIFVGGDSAGGNICHTLLACAGRSLSSRQRPLPESVRVEGMILAHPYFGIGGRDEEMWLYMCPTNEGPNDRRLKPTLEDLATIRCERVLVLVAENDPMNVAGKRYVEDLIKSGWKGTVEIVENTKKNHCFHLYNLEDQEAIANMRRITSFIHSSHYIKVKGSNKNPNLHLYSSL
ncbi:2-hydroxyisoflavanone dehydratase-like [Spinacia oleracea]|uniref:2-hydroxyisoflavanone dehydratase-like n=1 Tax=Spinacia oleracea TaxID=3562 RepID=A0ABM3RNJ8_SPIOL|nr:2-hydroxyisoflavanone dehydratase-like [Spinacia oleracea]